MKTFSYPSVLTIAGFDGSGGAGIQADIKTISALGCYATSVLTALPIQNTMGVKSICPIPYQAVSEQLHTVLEDVFPDAVKIGMVHSGELVRTITDILSQYPKTPVVFDPVMVATSGDRLIEENTIADLIDHLFPVSMVVTPNLDEAAILAEMPVKSLDDMYVASGKIIKLGCQAVLIKGGHLEGDRITSLFVDREGNENTVEFEKFDTTNTHGSGCTLSSAIASFIARGESLAQAVSSAQNYVHQAIYHGKDVSVGKGNGPLNHFFNPVKLIKNDLVN